MTTWSKLAGSSGGNNQYMLAIKTDGTLWSWGRNNNGQLGFGTSGTNYSSPKQVGSLTSWNFVFSGGSTSSFGIAKT